jgi:thiamine-phosphate pyrophosphorylase
MAGPNLQLHLISDTQIQNRYTHFELAYFAFEAQATIFQFREKNLKREHIQELKQIIALRKKYNVKVIVNDYLDLALEVGADGVHLGAEDAPLAEAISAAGGKDFIIGATCHTAQELDWLNANYTRQITYIGVGPVWGSASKKICYPALGVEGLAWFCRRSHFPVIAIGNIQLPVISAVIASGASGVAVISAFCNQTSPYKAAKSLRQALLQSASKR